MASDCSKPGNTEKKCEREFRKLFENDVPVVAKKNYVRKKNFFADLDDEDSAEEQLAKAEEEAGNLSSSDESKENEDDQLGNIESAINESCTIIESHRTSSVTEEPTNIDALSAQFKRFEKFSVICTNELTEKEIQDVLAEILPKANTVPFPIMHLSDALLVYILTKKTLSSDIISIIEKAIVKQVNVKGLHDTAFTDEDMRLSFQALGNEKFLKASDMLDEIFRDYQLNPDSINTLYVHHLTLKNISDRKLALMESFSDEFLKCIFGMIGKSTQEIVSENISSPKDVNISIAAQIVNLCLQIFENFLSADSNLPWKDIYHDEFSIHHCLTKLIAGCISYLYPAGQFDNNGARENLELFTFQRSTLVCILKVLATLSYNPEQYDDFTNLRGLMEAVMICTLKTYFYAKEDPFDILVLALELLINFSIKHKKTFTLLCVKKFAVKEDDQILAIEALLKILLNSLPKIKEIREKLSSRLEAAEDDNSSTQSDTTSVIDDADKEMELSTISSFVSILLVSFMETKKSFTNFIRERLDRENCREAVKVAQNFLMFAQVTGMPITGALLLQTSIEWLSQMHPS